ncbi:MAG: 3-dehydroquinate dehydratase, partial [Chlamydiae bacterium]|nr:3-dehydroquinate dehydratase [Chlamydiota bacterium]
MLIGCITGPDLETTKSQIKLAQSFCDGIELRKDLLETDITISEGFVITTENGRSTLSTGQTLSTYHNFDETPEDLDAILKSMPPADFYKICTMANKTTDALRMLVFVKDKP